MVDELSIGLSDLGQEVIVISPYYDITYYIYGPVFVPLAEAAASIIT